MHLVSLIVDGSTMPGTKLGSDYLNLQAASSALGEMAMPPTMLELLAGGAAVLDGIRHMMDRATGPAEAQLREVGALIPAAAARLTAPITNPGLILAAGLNYHAHLAEMDNTPVPEKPNSFTKNASSIIGPEDAIVLPKAAPSMVDWEGELGVVIGCPCSDVSEEAALDCVMGYTMINDVSARDWVAPVFAAQGVFGPIMAWERNILGKQFPTFCPVGPVIATKDEIPDITDLHLETRVNGVVMQTTSTSDLVFNVAQLISYYSRFYAFRPGDLIATGSPPGVGFGRKPKLFLKPGNVVEVIGDHIGTLRNPVVSS